MPNKTPFQSLLRRVIRRNLGEPLSADAVSVNDAELPPPFANFDSGNTPPDPKATPSAFAETLLNAAWGASVSPGLIQHGFNLRRAEVVQARADIAALRGDLSDRLAATEDQLEALIAQPLPSPPPPKVLRSVASILPFPKGV
jgi:hypothetical protein